MPTNPAPIPAEWQHALAAHCRSQVRECDVWASFHVIAFIGVDVNVCGVCKRGESEPHPRTGLHFQLPPRWELLFPTRPDLVRLCRALGFGVPTEPTGPSNSNLLSLKHVISVYEAQLNLLLEAFDLATAMTRARDYMQMYEHQGARLGSVRERAGEWMFCGLLDAEETIPDAHKAAYCGGCFHLSCVGLITKPRANVGRLACIYCLQDRRYRDRPSACSKVQSMAMYGPNRILRVLNLATDTIPTMLLNCSCQHEVGVGLPCAAMFAVLCAMGAVPHHSLIHAHWLAHNVVGAAQGEAAIEGNQALVLDVAAVVNDAKPRAAPSALEPIMSPPSGVKVRGSRRALAAVNAVITQSAAGGRPIDAQGEADVKLHDVAAPPRQKKRKSRRHQSRRGQKSDTK